MSLVSIPSDCKFDEFLSYAPLESASGIESDGIPYDDGAFVPRPDFSSFDARGTALLSSELAASLERTVPMVSLVRMASALTDVLGSGLHASSQQEAVSVMNSFPSAAVAEAALASLRQSFVWSPSNFMQIGVSHNAPGLLTTTIDEKRGRRLGVHFDSWDRLPMSRRAMSRYRLSMNVGAGDRFFLFMPFTAADVLATVVRSGVSSMNATDMLRLALTVQHPRFVYRLRVPPSWAYIAPTDNLPHDGSTLGARSFDFSTHFLADFRPLKDYFQVASFIHIKE